MYTLIINNKGVDIMEIKAVLNQFIEEITITKSPATVSAYSATIKEFITVNELKGFNVDRSAAKHFINYMEEKGLAINSRRQKLTILKTFYKYLKVNGIVEVNIFDTISLPKQQARLPKFKYQTDVVKVIESLDNVRNRLIVEILFSTGIRVSELTNIEIGDFRRSERLLLVTGKGGKQRYVPYGEEMETLLQHYLEIRNSDHPHLILNRDGQPLSNRQVQRITEKLGFNPHQMRHSYATALLDNGAGIRDVQELLGHENLSTTQIYTHLSKEKLKAIHTGFHPRG